MDLPTADRGHPAAATVAVDQRRSLGLLLCALVLAAVSVLSLAIGTHSVGLSTVWQVVTHYTDSGDQWIVHDLRFRAPCSASWWASRWVSAARSSRG